MQQAETFKRCYDARKPGDLPPTIDVEFPGNGIGDTSLTAPQALDRLLTALGVLRAEYGTVMIYTSARVWAEDLRDIDCTDVASCPLWLKVSYPFRAGQPPHRESVPAVGALPRPWRAAGSAGAWIEQYQGDSVAVPGFSSTVDLNEFLLTGHEPDPRAAWVADRVQSHGRATIDDFQTSVGLAQDGIIGLDTFCALA
jgi:hypothetical protein